MKKLRKRLALLLYPEYDIEFMALQRKFTELKKRKNLIDVGALKLINKKYNLDNTYIDSDHVFIVDSVLHGKVTANNLTLCGTSSCYGSISLTSPMSKPKSWNTCEPCGDKFFPNVNKSNWHGITMSIGTCPDCGTEDVTLIPIRDFDPNSLFD